MSFADKVKKLIDEAPEASGRTNVNFGPTTFTPIVVDWSQKDSDGRPLKTPLTEYMEEQGIGEDDELTLGKDQSLQLHVDIDVTALNPTLDFHVERDIVIRDSNKKNKDPNKWILTSWSEIVLPSLEATFGKDWYKKVLPNGKKGAPIVYTASENVDQVEPVKEGKKAYGVPKFIGVYKDLDACRKARDERYPPRDDSFNPEDLPEEGEEDETGFPADVLKEVKDLYASTRKNARQTIKIIESDEAYSEYDARELLQAALPDVELPKK